MISFTSGTVPPGSRPVFGRDRYGAHCTARYFTYRYLAITFRMVTIDSYMATLSSQWLTEGWCRMTVHERTQVGIVGAGPAGLLLSHLLALGGVDSVCVENRSRAYCEARQRAGMLESTTVELLRTVGLGDRLYAG